MHLSLLLISQIGSMFIMIAFGYLAVRAGMLLPRHGRVLSVLSMYIIGPCMTLSSFQIEFTYDKLRGLGLAMGAAAIVHVIYIALTKALKKPLKLRDIERASLIYSNAGNMIIPLVNATLGMEWVFYTSAFTFVQTFLMWSHARSMISGENAADIRKMLLNPNVISKVISFILFVFRISLPDIVKNAALSVGQMIGPISMIIVGLLIAGMNKKDLFRYRRVFVVIAGRLIVYPLIITAVFAVLAKTGLHPDLKQILLIVLLASSSPSASTITQLAQVYDCEPEYSGIINIATIMFCIVTMPLIVTAYQYLAGML